MFVTLKWQEANNQAPESLPLFEDLSQTLGTDKRHVGTDKIRWSMSMSMKSTPTQQTICFLLTMISDVGHLLFVLFCLFVCVYMKPE